MSSKETKSDVMNQVVAAVDIGGTNVVFGLVDVDGEVISRGSIRMKDFPQPQQLVDKVSTEIKVLLDILQDNVELMGVGIGAPNGNFYSGNVEFAPNLNWFGVIPLAKMFSDKLNCKATLTNDANAAALGEMLFGAAKGMRDFLFITLGTGLGSGIVVNGEVVYGHDGFAGELGHIIVIPDGRQCGCGRNGCLETYASATGIKRTYVDMLMSRHKHNDLDDKVADARYIFERAVAGDQDAVEAFKFTGEILGTALANSVAYTSPEAIFLFGGLAQAGHYIFTPVVDSFERNLLNIYKGKVRILPSKLTESDAALLGAASLAWKAMKL